MKSPEIELTREMCDRMMDPNPLPKETRVSRTKKLEAENAELWARIAELQTPDMFWDDDEKDPISGDTEKEAIEDYLNCLNMSPGGSCLITINTARTCPALYIVARKEGDEDVYQTFYTFAEANAACKKANATTGEQAP